MTFPILQESCRDISDVNNETVKNVTFRCSLSFSEVLDVVAALYNTFQTRLQPCYKFRGQSLSSKHNFKSPVLPPPDLSDTLHTSLNMFSDGEIYVSLPFK